MFLSQVYKFDNLMLRLYTPAPLEKILLAHVVTNRENSRVESGLPQKSKMEHLQQYLMVFSR